MFKEMIITIIIVISIVTLDYITQNYTKESVRQTSSSLKELKVSVINNEEKINNNLEKVMKKWRERKKNLAYFIEHDELEKVETNLTNIKSYIDVEEYDMAINNIDEADYILSHIERKNSFELENIF